MGGPGLYDVIIFLDSPKIIHGFELAVTPNPALEVDKHLPHVVISPLIPKMPANAGADATFKFRVADKKTDAPVTGVSDLVIVIMAPNNWHTRQIAKEEGGGVYSVVVLRLKRVCTMPTRNVSR